MCDFVELWSFENYTSKFKPHLRHKILCSFSPSPQANATSTTKKAQILLFVIISSLNLWFCNSFPQSPLSSCPLCSSFPFHFQWISPLLNSFLSLNSNSCHHVLLSYTNMHLLPLPFFCFFFLSCLVNWGHCFLLSNSFLIPD